MKALYVLAASLMLALCGSANALSLYVDPVKGNDNNGGSSADPFRSLNGAHAYLTSTRPNESTTIYLAKGTQRLAKGYTWKYRSDYRVTILGNSTVVDGAGYPGAWLTVATEKGKSANLVVASVTLKNFGTGINVQGDRSDKSRGFISGITITKMTFDRIGGKFTSNKVDTYGAVRFVNARNSKVVRSTFRNIENSRRPELLHAVYLAHYSSGNTVSSNKFYNVSGDPVRTRDASNEAVITGNSFVKTGVAAHYSDWYCDGSACTKGSRECPSRGVIFKNNQYGAGYKGSVSLFKLFGSSSACGTGKRLSTSGNVRL